MRILDLRFPGVGPSAIAVVNWQKTVSDRLDHYAFAPLVAVLSLAALTPALIAQLLVALGRDSS